MSSWAEQERDEARAALREIDNAVDGGADNVSPTLFKVERMRAENERLRIALVDAVHRLHATPQHMLVAGVGMSEGGRGFGVHYRAADGLMHDVYASRAELDAVDAANAAERQRVDEALARADAANSPTKTSAAGD